MKRKAKRPITLTKRHEKLAEHVAYLRRRVDWLEKMRESSPQEQEGTRLRRLAASVLNIEIRMKTLENDLAHLTVGFSAGRGEPWRALEREK